MLRQSLSGHSPVTPMAGFRTDPPLPPRSTFPFAYKWESPVAWPYGKQGFTGVNLIAIWTRNLIDK
jgi:hypothetical protein